MKQFTRCLTAAALLFVVAVFAQQQPSDESTIGEKSSPAFDLELKKREIEGQYNATKESLAVVIQQLTGQNLGQQERARLEGEEAKLRPQAKSLSEQLDLINQRLAEAPQSDAKLPPAKKAPGTPDPHVSASLLIIKADWSTVKDADQIKREIETALADSNVPRELLDRLPASGPEILFPLGVAAVYRGEHYPQLLAWLKVKKLLLEELPFNVTSEWVRRRNNLYGTDVHGTLDMSYELFDLPPLTIENNQPFFKRELGIQWSFDWKSSQTWDESMPVNRKVGVLETPRGETQKIMKVAVDEVGFAIPNINRESHEAVLFNALPDERFRDAAARKGFSAAMVIRAQPPATETPAPAIVPPDAVKTLKPHFGEVWGRAQGAKLIFQTDGTLKWWREPDAAETATRSTTAETVSEPAQPQLAEPQDAASGGSFVRVVEPGQAPADRKTPGPELKVFTLKNASAVEAQRIISQLFRPDQVSAAADERSNSVVAWLWPGYINAIEELIGRLEIASPPAAETSTTTRGEAAKRELSASVTDSKSRYEASEENANSLAGQVRKAQSGPRPNKSEIDRLTSQLRTAVAVAFAARQQLHEAELTQLQQRIESTRQSLEARKRLHDQIIDRRVKDLLNPDLQWDTSPLGQSSTPRLRGDSDSTSTSSSRADANAPATASGMQSLKNRGISTAGQPNTVVLTVLGVRTLAVEGESINKAGYEGGLLIEGFRQGSQSGELKVGDIIVGLGKWTTTNETQLAWAVLQPISKDLTVRHATARLIEEPAQIHVLRDGKPLTVQVVLQPYSLGSGRGGRSGTAPPGATTTSSTSKSRYAWDPNAESNFAALGLTVQKLTADDAPDPRFVGAMKITAIQPDSVARSRLAVGDIILAIQVAGVPARGGTALRAFTLRVVRGSEEFTFQFPTPSSAAPAKSGEASTSARDLGAARAVRDKLRERWQIMEPIYTAGRASLESALQAATQAGDADIQAAANAEEEIAARKELVERLKRLKDVVEAKYNNDVEPKQNLLTVEAALLKAEAELAAQSQRPAATSRDWSAQSSSGSSTKSTNDASSAIAYRDKLRERLALLNRSYGAGEIPFLQLLRAQLEFTDADIAASMTADERKAARQAKVSILKNMVDAQQRLHAAGEANESDLLAAQADLIKAEGELKGETNEEVRATTERSARTAAVLPPRLPLPSGGDTVILRSADDFRNELRAVEDSISNIKAWMKGVDPSGRGGTVTQRERDSAEKALPSWERRLKWARDQYDAQIRILELDLEDAKSGFNAAYQKRERLENLKKSGTVPITAITEAERGAETAKLRLERAQTILNLYRKADPKNAPSAPQAAPKTEPSKD